MQLRAISATRAPMGRRSTWHLEATNRSVIKMYTLVEPQGIFLERPSRNAINFQGQRISFKDFQALAKTTENLQGEPKNSLIPCFATFSFSEAFFDMFGVVWSLKWFVWSPGSVLGSGVWPENRFQKRLTFFHKAFNLSPGSKLIWL